MLTPNRLINENAHMCVYVYACVHAVIIRAISNQFCSFALQSSLSSVLATTHMITPCAYVVYCVVCEGYACLGM